MPWGRGWAIAAILAHVGHRVRWVTQSRQTNLAMQNALKILHLLSSPRC